MIFVEDIIDKYRKLAIESTKLGLSIKPENAGISEDDNKNNIYEYLKFFEANKDLLDKEDKQYTLSAVHEKGKFIKDGTGVLQPDIQILFPDINVSNKGFDGLAEELEAKKDTYTKSAIIFSTLYQYINNINDKNKKAENLEDDEYTTIKKNKIELFAKLQSIIEKDTIDRDDLKTFLMDELKMVESFDREQILKFFSEDELNIPTEILNDLESLATETVDDSIKKEFAAYLHEKTKDSNPLPEIYQETYSGIFLNMKLSLMDNIHDLKENKKNIEAELEKEQGKEEKDNDKIFKLEVQKNNLQREIEKLERIQNRFNDFIANEFGKVDINYKNFEEMFEPNTSTMPITTDERNLRENIEKIINDIQDNKEFLQEKREIKNTEEKEDEEKSLYANITDDIKNLYIQKNEKSEDTTKNLQESEKIEEITEKIKNSKKTLNEYYKVLNIKERQSRFAEILKEKEELIKSKEELINIKNQTLIEKEIDKKEITKLKNEIKKLQEELANEKKEIIKINTYIIKDKDSFEKIILSIKALSKDKKYIKRINTFTQKKQEIEESINKETNEEEKIKLINEKNELINKLIEQETVNNEYFITELNALIKNEDGNKYELYKKLKDIYLTDITNLETLYKDFPNELEKISDLKKEVKKIAIHNVDHHTKVVNAINEKFEAFTKRNEIIKAIIENLGAEISEIDAAQIFKIILNSKIKDVKELTELVFKEIKEIKANEQKNTAQNLFNSSIKHVFQDKIPDKYLPAAIKHFNDDKNATLNGKDYSILQQQAKNIRMPKIGGKPLSNLGKNSDNYEEERHNLTMEITTNDASPYLTNLFTNRLPKYDRYDISNAVEIIKDNIFYFVDYSPQGKEEKDIVTKILSGRKKENITTDEHTQVRTDNLIEFYDAAYNSFYSDYTQDYFTANANKISVNTENLEAIQQELQTNKDNLHTDKCEKYLKYHYATRLLDLTKVDNLNDLLKNKKAFFEAYKLKYQSETGKALELKNISILTKRLEDIEEELKKEYLLDTVNEEKVLELKKAKRIIESALKEFEIFNKNAGDLKDEDIDYIYTNVTQDLFKNNPAITDILEVSRKNAGDLTSSVFQNIKHTKTPDSVITLPTFKKDDKKNIQINTRMSNPIELNNNVELLDKIQDPELRDIAESMLMFDEVNKKLVRSHEEFGTPVRLSSAFTNYGQTRIQIPNIEELKKLCGGEVEVAKRLAQDIDMNLNYNDMGYRSMAGFDVRYDEYLDYDDIYTKGSLTLGTMNWTSNILQKTRHGLLGLLGVTPNFQLEDKLVETENWQLIKNKTKRFGNQFADTFIPIFKSDNYYYRTGTEVQKELAHQLAVDEISMEVMPQMEMEPFNSNMQLYNNLNILISSADSLQKDGKTALCEKTRQKYCIKETVAELRSSGNTNNFVYKYDSLEANMSENPEALTALKGLKDFLVPPKMLEAPLSDEDYQFERSKADLRVEIMNLVKDFNPATPDLFNQSIADIVKKIQALEAKGEKDPEKLKELKSFLGTKNPEKNLKAALGMWKEFNSYPKDIENVLDSCYLSIPISEKNDYKEHSGMEFSKVPVKDWMDYEYKKTQNMLKLLDNADKEPKQTKIYERKLEKARIEFFQKIQQALQTNKDIYNNEVLFVAIEEARKEFLLKKKNIISSAGHNIENAQFRERDIKTYQAINDQLSNNMKKIREDIQRSAQSLAGVLPVFSIFQIFKIIANLYGELFAAVGIIGMLTIGDKIRQLGYDRHVKKLTQANKKKFKLIPRSANEQYVSDAKGDALKETAKLLPESGEHLKNRAKELGSKLADGSYEKYQLVKPITFDENKNPIDISKVKDSFEAAIESKELLDSIIPEHLNDLRDRIKDLDKYNQMVVNKDMDTEASIDFHLKELLALYNIPADLPIGKQYELISARLRHEDKKVNIDKILSFYTSDELRTIKRAGLADKEHRFLAYKRDLIVQTLEGLNYEGNMLLINAIMALPFSSHDREMIEKIKKDGDIKALAELLKNANINSIDVNELNNIIVLLTNGQYIDKVKEEFLQRQYDLLNEDEKFKLHIVQDRLVDYIDIIGNENSKDLENELAVVKKKITDLKDLSKNGPIATLNKEISDLTDKVKEREKLLGIYELKNELKDIEDNIKSLNEKQDKINNRKEQIKEIEELIQKYKSKENIDDDDKQDIAELEIKKNLLENEIIKLENDKNIELNSRENKKKEIENKIKKIITEEVQEIEEFRNKIKLLTIINHPETQISDENKSKLIDEIKKIEDKIQKIETDITSLKTKTILTDEEKNQLNNLKKELLKNQNKLEICLNVDFPVETYDSLLKEREKKDKELIPYENDLENLEKKQKEIIAKLENLKGFTTKLTAMKNLYDDLSFSTPPTKEELDLLKIKLINETNIEVIEEILLNFSKEDIAFLNEKTQEHLTEMYSERKITDTETLTQEQIKHKEDLQKAIIRNKLNREILKLEQGNFKEVNFDYLLKIIPLEKDTDVNIKNLYSLLLSLKTSGKEYISTKDLELLKLLNNKYQEHVSLDKFVDVPDLLANTVEISEGYIKSLEFDDLEIKKIIKENLDDNHHITSDLGHSEKEVEFIDIDKYAENDLEQLKMLIFKYLPIDTINGTKEEIEARKAFKEQFEEKILSGEFKYGEQDFLIYITNNFKEFNEKYFNLKDLNIEEILNNILTEINKNESKCLLMKNIENSEELKAFIKSILQNIKNLPQETKDTNKTPQTLVGTLDSLLKDKVKDYKQVQKSSLIASTSKYLRTYTTQFLKSYSSRAGFDIDRILSKEEKKNIRQIQIDNIKYLEILKSGKDIKEYSDKDLNLISERFNDLTFPIEDIEHNSIDIDISKYKDLKEVFEKFYKNKSLDYLNIMSDINIPIEEREEARQKLLTFLNNMPSNEQRNQLINNIRDFEINNIPITSTMSIFLNTQKINLQLFQSSSTPVPLNININMPLDQLKELLKELEAEVSNISDKDEKNAIIKDIKKLQTLVLLKNNIIDEISDDLLSEELIKNDNGTIEETLRKTNLIENYLLKKGIDSTLLNLNDRNILLRKIVNIVQDKKNKCLQDKTKVTVTPTNGKFKVFSDRACSLISKYTNDSVKRFGRKAVQTVATIADKTINQPEQKTVQPTVRNTKFRR